MSLKALIFSGTNDYIASATEGEISLERVKPLLRAHPRHEAGFWSMTLGGLQFVLVLGVFLGLLAVAYGIGFFQGKDEGFEGAMARSLREQVPVPIPESERAALFNDEIAASLYARLGDSLDEEESAKDGSALENLDPKPLALGQQAEGVSVSGSDETQAPLLRLRDEQSALVVEEIAPVGIAAGDDISTGIPGKSAKPSLGDLLNARETPKPEKQFIREIPILAAEMDKKVVEPAAQEKLNKNVILEPESKSQKVELPISADPPAKQVAKLSAAKQPVELPHPTAVLDPQSSVPPGWYAQISAPEDKGVADDLVAKLQSAGFPALIEAATVRGTRYYRVLVGPEPDRTLARRLLTQVAREPFVQGSPFIKQIQ
jgi:cell division septation protein DedD